MTNTAVAHPLVLVGIGATGHRVITDLQHTASSLPVGDREATTCIQLVPGPRGPAALQLRLQEELRRLLRAGAVRGASDGRARLDIVLIGAVDEAPPDAWSNAVDIVNDVLNDQFAVLFPPSATPEHRSVWLSLVMCMPPLTSQAGDALGIVQALEQKPDVPALSRMWLLPRQTTAGRLSEDDVDRSLRCFVQGIYLSGVRRQDAVQRRLAHRHDGRRVGMISVAAAELPVARLRRYARWRAAWDGLSTLVDQAERPTGDPARAEALVARVDVDDLLEAFREGRVAQRTRKHAATLSGATDRLPDDIRGGLLEREDDLRHRYRVLFGPLVKPPPDRATDAPEHAEVLRDLDASESAALSDAEARLEHLLDHELDPRTALQVMPHLESALHRVSHDLQEDLHKAAPRLPDVDPPPPPEDPGLDRLEHAVRARPTLLGLLPAAVGLCFVAGVVTALGGVALLVQPDPSVAGGFSSTAGAPDMPVLVPVLSGIFVALLVGVSWTLLLLHRARVRVVDQLHARRQELEDSWSRGGGGQPGRQAQALLDVRRRRATAGVLAVLNQTIHRLKGARASLREARDHARRELERLRVRLGSSPATDDLSDLLGPETPLHHPLLPADVVVARVHAARTTQDPARWAQVLLEGIWPKSGLVQDLPGADPGAVAAACDVEVPDLGAEALLRGEAVVPLLQRRLQTFLHRLGGGLAWGVVPRDHLGDPVSSALIDPWMCIAPTALRPVLEPDLARRTDRIEAVWAEPDAPWVVVIASWDGLDMASVVRGAEGGLVSGALIYDLPFELHALAWSLCLPLLAGALLLAWAAVGAGPGSRIRRALFAFGPAMLAAPVASILMRVVQLIHPDIGRSMQVWMLAWIPEAIIEEVGVVLPDFAHPYDAAIAVHLITAGLVFFVAPLAAIIRRPRPDKPPALNGPLPFSLVVSVALLLISLALPWVLHRAMGAHIEWLVLEWIAIAPITALCLALRLHAIVPPPAPRKDRALAEEPKTPDPDIRAAWITAGVLAADAKPLFQITATDTAPVEPPTDRSAAAWQAVQAPGRPPGALDTLLEATDVATWLVGDLPLETEAALVDAFLVDAVGTRGARVLAVVPHPEAFAKRHFRALTRVHTWTPGHVAVGAAELREALARKRVPSLTLVTPEELAGDLLELVGRDGRTWACALDWMVLHRPDAGGPMQVTHTAFTLKRWALATSSGPPTAVLATGADTPAVLSLLESLFPGRPTRRCPLRPRDRGPATIWPALLDRSSSADPWSARAARATTALQVPTWLTDTEGHLDPLAHQDPLLTVDGDLDMPGLASAAQLTVPSLPLAWRMAQQRLPDHGSAHHALWNLPASPVSRFLLQHGRMAAFHERRELPVPRPVVGTHNRFLRLAHLRAALDDAHVDESSLRRAFGDDVVDYALREIERTGGWLARLEDGRIERAAVLRGPPGVKAPEPDRLTITPQIVQVLDDSSGKVITRVDARLAATRFHPKRVFAIDGRRYRVPLHALDDKRAQLRVVPADPRDPLTRPVLRFELRQHQTVVDRVVRRQQGVEVATSTVQAVVEEQVVGAWVPGTDQREAFGAVSASYDTEVRLVAVKGATRGPALTHLAHLVDALLPLHLCVDRDDVEVIIVDPPVSPGSGPALAILDRHVGGLGIARTLDDGTIIEVLRWARAMLHACDCERGCHKCTPERVLIGGGDKAGVLRLLA